MDLSSLDETNNKPLAGYSTEFMDTTTGSGLQQNGLNGDGDYDRDGDGPDSGDEKEDDVSKLFMQAIQFIMQLETRKASVDDEESKVKATLKEKHEADRNEIKISGELLSEKEALRDKLMSLKETREKLIDELHLFKTIDDEMQGFNRVNESFNDNLRKHLALIEDKQAKIYTLKPVITGVHVSSDCNFARDERSGLHAALIQALKDNAARLESELRKTCEENHMKTTEEWTKLQSDERAAKKRIQALKQKLNELNRAKNKKAGKKPPSSTPSSAADINDDDDDSSTRGSRGKRSVAKADDGWSCEGCNTSFPSDGHFKFAYHCFRGCSKLEDLMHDVGKGWYSLILLDYLVYYY